MMPMPKQPPSVAKPKKAYLEQQRGKHLDEAANHMCTDSEFAEYNKALKACVVKKDKGEQPSEQELDALVATATPIIRYALLQKVTQAMMLTGFNMDAEAPRKRSITCKGIHVRRIPVETVLEDAKPRRGAPKSRALVNISQEAVLKTNKSTDTPLGVVTFGAGTGGQFDLKVRPGREGARTRDCERRVRVGTEGGAARRGAVRLGLTPPPPPPPP